MAGTRPKLITLPLALAVVALAVLDSASGDSANPPATEPPPNIRITEPEDQALLRSGSFEIAGDFAGSATEIEVFADGELLGPALRGDEAFDWRLPARDVDLADGLHRISAVATGEGGESRPASIWVFVDPALPFEIAVVPEEASYLPGEDEDDPQLLLLGNDVSLTLTATGTPGVDAVVTETLTTGTDARLRVDIVTETPGVYPSTVTAVGPDGTVREATHTITIIGPPPTTAAPTTTTTTRAAGPLGPVRTLFDDFEGADQWTSTVELTTNGSSETAALAGGGNPGGQRRMTHVMPGTDDGENNPTQIAVLHVFTGGGWDPSVDGPLAHVDYAEDQIEFEPPFDGAAIGTRFAIVQDGTTYLAGINPPDNAFRNTAWQTARVVNLTPEDFVPAPGPDFSADGGPMAFGYTRSNTSRGGREIILQHGIDNWTVELFAAAP